MREHHEYLAVVSGLLFAIFGCSHWSGSRPPSTDFCGRLAELREMPFNAADPVVDPIYAGLVGEGRAAIPCLIERVTDATPMPDPRKAPPFNGFAVGDAAAMMIADITGIPLEDMMPEPVRARWREQGVYAYFAYVFEKPGNRGALRSSWRRRLLGP